MKNLNKGFTLIELLVVISIISYLSSIVLNQVSSARDKAKDAAIMQAMKQFEVLLTLEYNENKTYANLQTINSTGGWITASTGGTQSCAANFAGNYMAKAREICNNIISNTSATSKMYADTAPLPGPVENDQKYSIMAPLSTGKWFCIGSSGSSITSDNVNWLGLGCYANP